MAVQYGKCTNRAGCTLAYTGDQIRFEGTPICPECGQPLAVIKGPGGSGSKLWLLILLPIVLVGMIAAGYFVVQAALSWGSKATTTTATATPSATAAPTASETPTATATASTTPSTTPDQGTSPGSPGPSPSATGGSVNSNPGKLSDSDIEATRKQVLTRLEAMPGKSKDEKAKLADKVQSARSMERLQVVLFDLGRSMIGRPEVDKMIASFNDAKMKEKLGDPTLVLVVAGYADKSGNPQGNQALSNARAENIARLLKQAGVTNVIHTVAMGGTDVLENTRPDQNRAVEIWSVIP